MTATRNRHSTMAVLVLAALLTLGITFILSGLLHKDDAPASHEKEFVTVVRAGDDGNFQFGIPFGPKTDSELIEYGKFLCDGGLASNDDQLAIQSAAQTYLCP